MIRLIASDIDGTLVPDSSDHIDPVYYDLIRELKKRGVYFCVCSGRQWVVEQTTQAKEKGNLVLCLQRQTVSQHDEAFFTGC